MGTLSAAPMNTPDRTPPEGFPYVIHETKLIDISDLRWYLYFGAMSDSSYESDHREVTWDSLGCSFRVACVFDKTVRVSFREGPPSDTESSGLRDPSSEKEQKRQALYDYDPTYHLSSDRLRSEITIRTDVNNPPVFEAPSSTLKTAIQALSDALITGESTGDVMARPAYVLLEGFGDRGAAAFDYQRNSQRGGRLIQFFHERPVTEAIERRMVDRIVGAIGNRTNEIENNGGDPSPLQKDLSLLSDEISEAGLSEKTAEVARKLAGYVQ